MTYQPNFQEPRIRRRTETVLGWCAASLSTDKPRFWTRKQLDKRFGQSHNDLSGWLRSQLLIEACTYNMYLGRAKTYLLNEPNFLKLQAEFWPAKTQVNTASDWAAKEYQAQFDSGDFEYQDKSQRLWNDLQRIPTAIRRPLFAQNGYRYEYDIEACAPTLIYQYAIKCGLTRPTPRLCQYLDNRTELRSRLEQDLGCEPNQAKRIITAMFSGARLGVGNSIAAILNNNLHQVQKLSSLKYIKDLQKDIKKCWDKIKVQEESLRLSSRDKWLIYFRLERSVMDVIKKYLKKNSLRYFLEHDGWRCDQAIDPIDLEVLVKRSLGYQIKLEWNKYDDL